MPKETEGLTIARRGMFVAGLDYDRSTINMIDGALNLKVLICFMQILG